jgi:pteridine reductase
MSTLKPMVETVLAKTRRLDVLVNNASSFYPTPLGSITEEQWDDLVGSNLKAPLFLCQAALPSLMASKGVIINIVDVHAQRPLRNHPLYGIAKAGLAMLTRALAKDLGPDIRVNGVSPGAILWPDTGVPEKIQQSIIREIALKRPGEPEDIASAVVYLVRDAPYVTGHILAVDGGRSVGW